MFLLPCAPPIVGLDAVRHFRDHVVDLTGVEESSIVFWLLEREFPLGGLGSIGVLGIRSKRCLSFIGIVSESGYVTDIFFRLEWLGSVSGKSSDSESNEGLLSGTSDLLSS